MFDWNLTSNLLWMSRTIYIDIVFHRKTTSHPACRMHDLPSLGEIGNKIDIFNLNHWRHLVYHESIIFCAPLVDQKLAFIFGILKNLSKPQPLKASNAFWSFITSLSILVYSLSLQVIVIMQKIEVSTISLNVKTLTRVDMSSLYT